jgi:hypothetical protein
VASKKYYNIDVKVKNFGLRLFTGSSIAKVRIVGLQVLQRLFSTATGVANIDGSADALDVDTVVTRHLFGTLSQSARVSGSLIQVNVFDRLHHFRVARKNVYFKEGYSFSAIGLKIFMAVICTFGMGK